MGRGEGYIPGQRTGLRSEVAGGVVGRVGMHSGQRDQDLGKHVGSGYFGHGGEVRFVEGVVKVVDAV